MLLPFTFQHTRQPRGGAQLQKSFAGVPIGIAITPFGVRNRGVLSLGGDTTLIPTPQGMAWTGDELDRIVYTHAGRPFVFARDLEITFVCCFRKRTAAISTGAICGLGSSSGGSGNTLCYMRGGSASADAVVFVVQDVDTNIAYNTETVSLGLTDLLPHTVVVSAGLVPGDRAVHYVDGKFVQSIAHAGASINTTTFEFVNVNGIIRGGSSLAFGDYDVLFFVPLFGKLPTQQCLSLSANPWQLFEPEMQFGFKAAEAVAGGRIYSLHSGLVWR